MLSTYVGKLNLGKFDNLPYADNEIIIMTFVHGFEWDAPNKQPVVIYHQWTKGSDGEEKVTSSVVASIQSITPTDNVFWVGAWDYAYGFNVHIINDGEELEADMYKNPDFPKLEAKIQFKRQWKSTE